MVSSSSHRSISPRLDAQQVAYPCFAFLISAFLCVEQASAQSQILIKDAADCARCRIVLDSVVTLVGSDSVALSHFSRAVATADRFFVGPTYSPGQIAVFDRRGRLQGTIGRAGMGPGEIRGGTLSLAVGPGDTLHVINENRWIVLAPPNYHFVRVTVLTGAPTSFAVIDHGEHLGDLVAAYPLQAASGVMFTVHLVSAISGNVIRSYDAPATTELRDVAGTLRVISWNERRLWSATMNRIRISGQSLDQDSIRSWVRTESWFTGWSETDDMEPFFRRPRPNVRAVRAPGNLIWLYATVADKEWRPVVTQGRDNPLESVPMARLRSIDPSSILDSMVEVVGRDTGEALARVQLDRIVRPVDAAGSMVQNTRERTDGEVVIELHTIRLVRE